MDVAVLFGGGQIPDANIVTAKLIKKLLRRLDVIVYGIHKSFMGLADLECYEKFNFQKADEIERFPGTYLSTCRKVDPSSNEWFGKIMKNLVKKQIKTIFLIGGDGSSRAAKDFLRRAKREGYDYLQIVYIPCTIDGINGSETIGLESAVLESERQANFAMINAFATWNPKFKGPRVAVIEMQGRNRNDIAINVMNRLISKGAVGCYSLSKVNLIFVPTGYNWSFTNLLEKINSSNKETAVIISEGAKPIEPYWEAIEGENAGRKLENLIKKSGIREVNFQLIGYLSQTNGMTSQKQIELIEEWTSVASSAIDVTKQSIAVVNDGEAFKLETIENFAAKNSSEKPVPLTDKEMEALASYLP